MNTADPGRSPATEDQRAAAGLVQARDVHDDQVVALGDPVTATLNYGFAELTDDYSATKTITLRNFGSSAATFNVSAAATRRSAPRTRPRRVHRA